MGRLEDAGAQARSLRVTEHRPYPLPRRQWVMGQTWQDLLFAHWRVAHDVLRPLPLLSSFLELNCRTYVRTGDRAGIWFFSLDASSRAAVTAAQRTYRLPYRYARIEAAGDSFRADLDGAGSFRVRYHGVGMPAAPERSTLEHFLTERCCLYAVTESFARRSTTRRGRRSRRTPRSSTEASLRSSWKASRSATTRAARTSSSGRRSGTRSCGALRAVPQALERARQPRR